MSLHLFSLSLKEVYHAKSSQVPNNISQQLTKEHKKCSNPEIGTHQTEQNQDNLSDPRQEAQETNPSSATSHKIGKFIHLLLIDTNPLLYLFEITDITQPITQSTTQSITNRGRDDTQHRVCIHTNQCREDQLRTERKNTSGNKCSQKQTYIAPIDKDINNSFHGVTLD